MKSNVIVGLPAYNEGNVLPILLMKLEALRAGLEEQLHIIVVDDGSTDDTAAILRDHAAVLPNMRVLTHKHNRGLGEAMSTLLDYVVTHFDYEDVLITLDADNTHSPSIIPDLFAKLRMEELDMVIASRYADGGQELGLAWHRKLFSRGARWFFKLFFPIANVNDYSSGFRCYRVGFLIKAMSYYNGRFITSSGFECMAEIMARFSRMGVRAGEYPLILEYHLKESKSKMNIWRTVIGYFRLLRKVKYNKKWSKEHAL
ncbi:glycosyltransferase family 2 protein [Paenibacillus vulneris]|uniref:Glycosyltransferase n=1 Tax=Paenibacillus vulneris TaxID=1133364 RepID=A0ABW3UU88_9BACL|nr:glycosyltransferase [Paenibacillus sp. 32352]